MLSEPGRVRRSPAAQSGQRVLEARVHRVAATGRLRVSEARAVGMVQAAGVGVIQVLLATPPDQRDPGLAESRVRRRARPDPHRPAGARRRRPDGGGGRRSGRSPPGSTALTAAERDLLVEWLDRVIDRGVIDCGA